jgi:hypothetical protein
MERKDIIILDCGIDMDKMPETLGCCTAALAPVRG